MKDTFRILMALAVLSFGLIPGTALADTNTQPAGTVTQPAGTATQPAGTVTQPAGTGTQPAGTATQPAGTATQPAGTTTQPAGTVTQPAGTATQPSGTATQPSGTATQPAGTATQPAGTATQPTDTSTQPAGTATQPSGTATQPSGTATQPSGTATQPEGTSTQPAGTATQPAGTATQPAGTGTQPAGTATQPAGTGTQPAGTGNQTPGTTTQQPAAQTPDIKLSEKITDHSTAIKGTTSPGGKITVANASGVIIATTQADASGNFTAAIPKQPANTVLKITAAVGTSAFSIQVTVAAAPPIGWIYNGGHWYYLDSNGNKMTGWILDRSVWYYLDKNGVMQTGWIYYGGYWYYLSTSGAMQTGWLYTGGHWYFLDQSGAMKTGWLFTGGKWYYLNGDGSMKTGWVQSGTDQYYLGSSGAISSVILDAPLILQNPELPRGCEVTSLAMMLQDAGIRVSKMTLASQVKKDPTPYSVSGGQIYFGNPNTGFVGDMYSFSRPGLAVYHGPIAALARQYLSNRIVDFSGGNFEQIYNYLNNGKPVWVINNVLFDTVPSQYWQQWNTPAGKISITYKEHSVLITGYDQNYIYFNDPLAGVKNRKVAISAFKRGWEQMGRQAISYN